MSNERIEEVMQRYFGEARREAAAVGEVRRAAFVPQIRSVNEAERTIEFVASTETPDRYGDVIRAAGFDLANYRRNPVFLWAHKSSEPPIGRTVDVRVEQSPKPALIQRVEFADKATSPFADQIYRLYRGGFLNAVSVGFLPLEKPKAITNEDGMMTGYEFTKQELLELSAVPLPANPEAVARSVSAGIVGEREVERYFGRQERRVGLGTTDVCRLPDLGTVLAMMKRYEALLDCVEGHVAREMVLPDVVNLGRSICNLADVVMKQRREIIASPEELRAALLN